MTTSSAPAGRTSSEEAGASLATLFDAHSRMVLGLCRFLLRDADEADDATQQTFLSAYQSLLSGTKPRNPAPWLAEIARNECRARIVHRMREPLPLAAATESAAYDPADAADQKQLLAELKSAISALPDRQREAIVLRDFYGLSYREVATAMTVSVPVVESLLFRARRRLHRRLRTLPRLGQGALAVPLALRDELERLIPGFDAAAAGLGITGGGVAVGGVVAKLAALPAGAKVATATTVAAVAVGGVVTPQVTDRHPPTAKPTSSVTAVPPAAAPEASASLDTAPVTAGKSLDAERQRDGASDEEEQKPPGTRGQGAGSTEREENDDGEERDVEGRSNESSEADEDVAKPETDEEESEIQGERPSRRRQTPAGAVPLSPRLESRERDEESELAEEESEPAETDEDETGGEGPEDD